jgi:hypothetical protein
MGRRHTTALILPHRSQRKQNFDSWPEAGATNLLSDMPLWEMAMGLVEIFILGWLTGATIARIYNFGLDKKP